MASFRRTLLFSQELKYETLTRDIEGDLPAGGGRHGAGGHALPRDSERDPPAGGGGYGAGGEAQVVTTVAGFHLHQGQLGSLHLEL